MKNEWDTQLLGTITDILDSQRKPVTKRDRKSGPYPYYGATGILDYVDGYLFDEPLILVGEDGAKWGSGENSAFAIDGKCWVNNHAHVLRPHRNKIIDNWLIYFLNYTDLMEYVSGLTVPKLNQGRLREIPIPIPSLPEQQRIVAKLDEAFAALAKAKENAEKNVANARAIFESELNAIFTKKGDDWIEKTLEQVSSEFGRGKSKHRPRNAAHLYGGKYPFVQTGDIRNAEHVLTDYSQTYSDAGLEQSKIWPKGTVCITIAANIAETAILDFDGCFPDSIIGMVPSPDQADSGFVEYLLQFYKVQIQARGKGSAQDNINMGTFENQLFPFPSVAEQERIARSLDDFRYEVKELRKNYERKLTALDALRQSMLRHAFNGQL